MSGRLHTNNPMSESAYMLHAIMLPTIYPSKAVIVFLIQTAHMKAVNTVSYVDEQALIITASTDCSVRLWTVTGRYIGKLGV